jgi:transcriptional regulator GlxA family with amidase domain
MTAGELVRRDVGEADLAKLAAIINAAAERLEQGLIEAGSRLETAQREHDRALEGAYQLADAALKLGWEPGRIARLACLNQRELGKRRKRMGLA